MRRTCTPYRERHNRRRPEAKAVRIQPMLYSDCAVNRYEQILQSAASDTQGVSALMAGASRLTRLQFPDQCVRSRTLWEVAAGVAAPTLTAYLLWLFQRARELDIRRLYFLSRDGQVLFEMARALVWKWNLDFELRYLYGSRQAWHRASVSEISERELGWIMDDTVFLSVESALARVCVDPKQVEMALVSGGFGREDWTRNLDVRRRGCLRTMLRRDPVARMIVQNAQKYRDTFLRYLRQEGLFDRVASGISDTGWQGRVLDSLALVLMGSGQQVPYGLYFGLCGPAITGPPKSPREGFYIDTHRGKGEPATLDQGRIAVVEMFCVADHGLVESYEERDGVVEPVLKESTNARVLNWGLSEVREAIASFVHQLNWQYSTVEDFDPFVRMVGRLMEEFWHRPSTEEARVWGALPFFEDQTEAYWMPLAERYRLSDLFRIARCGDMRKHNNSWVSASKLLTSTPIRTGLRPASYAGLCYGKVRRIMRDKFKYLTRCENDTSCQV